MNQDNLQKQTDSNLSAAALSTKSKKLGLLLGIILNALFLYIPLQSAIANTTITGTLASDKFSGQIDNQNENSFSAIFTVGERLSGSMQMEIDPADVGKESPLYLVAQWNNNWYVRDQSGNWRPWNQQLEDLASYSSRILQSKEILDLPLDYAQKKGDYTLFAGYLNHKQQIVFNKKPLGFKLIDETELGLQQFSSPAMMEQFLKDGLSVQANLIQSHGGIVLNGITELDAATVAPSTNATTRNYSTTNIQETGVEEADRIKTDGTRLYVLGDCSNQSEGENITAPIDNGVTLLYDFPKKDTCIITYNLSENPANAEKTSETILTNTHFFKKLYLTNDQIEGQADWLIAIGQGNAGNQIWYDPWGWQSQTTEIQWFNVDNDAALTLQHKVKLDGYLISSRRIDRILYAVTRYTPWIQNYHNYPVDEEQQAANEQILKKTSLIDLLPGISYDQGTFDQLVVAENCYMSPVAKDVVPDPSIITVTAISLDNPKQAHSTCIVGSSETLYMSPKSLYLATTKYQYPRFLINQNADIVDGQSIFDPDHQTEIHKFSINGVDVTYKGSGEVIGHLGWHEDKKPFRMSEHNGILRVATSVGDNWSDTSSTSLWTLQEAESTNQLEVAGHLPNLGKPGEQLYASRFIGDRGYLVTFLLTDPLYVLDLSNPASPKVLGELEIEGYSDYLHPISENFIVGIGKDAIADTQSSDWFGRGAWYQGLKLSLFDVSDPSQPNEVNSIVLGKRGTESDVLYDHHALAYLPPNDLRGARLAIPVRLHEKTPIYPESDVSLPWTWYEPTHTGLYLFDITVTGEVGITQQGKIIAQQAQANSPILGFPIYNSDRAVLRGDSVYYIHGSDVTTANWSDF